MPVLLHTEVSVILMYPLSIPVQICMRANDEDYD